MARLRYNGLTATLGADLLTAGTTITFTAALTHAAGTVPTITGADYIPLAILDADGKPVEIVHLTAYTSGATTGTVTRAQESTTAADRASGLTVIHGPTIADLQAGAVTVVPAGNIAATDVQAALVELDAEKAPATTARARAGASAAVSIPNGTITAVALNTEAYDTDNLHSTTTNNSRITLLKAGAWLVIGTLAYAPNATGRRIVLIYRNGVEASRSVTFPTVAQVAGVQTTTVVDSNGTSDYVEMMAYQDSGGALNTDPLYLNLTAVYLGI